jgi:hypothetical protein
METVERPPAIFQERRFPFAVGKIQKISWAPKADWIPGRICLDFINRAL